MLHSMLAQTTDKLIFKWPMAAVLDLKAKCWSDHENNTKYESLNPQGDILAPFLFIIVLDYALRKATDNHEELRFVVNPRRSRQMRTEKISDFNFADNISLLSDDLSTAKELLSRVETE